MDFSFAENKTIKIFDPVLRLRNWNVPAAAKRYSSGGDPHLCPDCQSPLLARYDLEAARANSSTGTISASAGRACGAGMNCCRCSIHAISSRWERGIARCCAWCISTRSSGIPNVFVKDESANPTGSFKARGLSAAISKAKELGIQKVIIPTAGNAGGAMAAYAARAGIQALDLHAEGYTPRQYRREPHGRARRSS